MYSKRIHFEGELHFTQLVSYMICICSFAKLDFVSRNKWRKIAGKTMKNGSTISRMSEQGLWVKYESGPKDKVSGVLITVS